MAAIGCAWLALVWLDHPVLGIDTLPLMRGTEAVDDCLRDFDLVDCETATPIDPFPALQHIPDLAAYGLLDLSDGQRVRGLALLSGLAIAAAVAAAWVVLRRVELAEWRWAFLAAVASGPILAYGNTTWGEMLAAGLLTLVVATTLLRAHPVLVGLASLGAGLSKETSYPFVLALAVIGLLLARRRTERPIRPHVVAVVAGLVLAVLVASALNLIRFGSPRNTHYLDDDLRTPTVGRMLEFAAGLFVSPNGGIVPFWPLASVLVALLLAIPIVCTIRGHAAVRETWPALGLAALIAALVLGFALWWVPFGWVAWGPRLSLPWVLPILLLALVAFARLLRPLVARAVGSAVALSFTCGTIVVLSTPHVGLLWRYETVREFFTAQTERCPTRAPGPAHYECMHELMWSRGPIWIDALSGLASVGAVVTLAGVAAVVVGSLTQLRRELLTR